MKAAIVDASGKLLYWGNTANPKFATTLPGNTRVNVPPDGGDMWDGNVWTTTPPPPPLPRQAPPIPSGTSVPALRDEVAALRQVLINAGILHD